MPANPASDPADARRPYVVALGGTTRLGSTTERALRVALRAAEEAGAETLLLGAADLELPMYAPERSERSPTAQRLVAAVRRADGLLIGSPGYHGSISGLVKNALDYIEDLRDAAPPHLPYLEGRAVGCIVVAMGWQATGTTLASLRAVVHALRGWPTPLGVTINSAEPVFKADGECASERVLAHLTLVGQQVVEFARMRLAAERLGARP